MNKKIILIAAAGILLLGSLYFLGQGGSTVTYVADVTAEVAGLEAELQEIEIEIAKGAVNVEEAVKRKASIAKRIETINSTIATNEGLSLSKEQRLQLVDTLGRVKAVLIAHADSLAVLDKVVDSVDESTASAATKELLKRGGGGRSRVLDDATTMVDTIAQHTEDVVDDFSAGEDFVLDVNEEEVEETSDEIVAEDAEDAAEAEPSEDADGTPESTDDTGTTTVSEDSADAAEEEPVSQ